MSFLWQSVPSGSPNALESPVAIRSVPRFAERSDRGPTQVSLSPAVQPLGLSGVIRRRKRAAEVRSAEPSNQPTAYASRLRVSSLYSLGPFPSAI